MVKIKKIGDRWFYLSGLGLLIIFIIKFISFLDLLKYFPLNYADLPLKLSELYFLANYGFHAVVPFWYNGFKVFEIYPPGWYFFSLPIYWITNNLHVAAFFSLILMLVLGLVASTLSFKKVSNKITFFIFFFMNPIVIDYIFFIGRFPELLGWVVYLFIFYLVFKYWNREVSKTGAFLFWILTSMVIFVHPYVAILALFLIFLLFLIKSKKEKFLIALSLLASLIFTSVYWIDFWKVILNNPYALYPTFYHKGTLLYQHSIVSFNTAVLLIWFFVFYFYKKDFIKSKKEKLFFYPLLILSILIITRIITLIPLFNEVPPNAFNLFFISLGLFMIFKIKFPDRIRKIFILGLLLIPILTAVFVFGVRPERNFEYHPEQEEMLWILSIIDGRYIFVNNNETGSNALVSIATIKYNLSTPYGLLSAQTPKQLQKDFDKTNVALEEKNCSEIKNNFKNLEVKNIISYKNSCSLLKDCGLGLEFEGEHSCLFTI